MKKYEVDPELLSTSFDNKQEKAFINIASMLANIANELAELNRKPTGTIFLVTYLSVYPNKIVDGHDFIKTNRNDTVKDWAIIADNIQNSCPVKPDKVIIKSLTPIQEIYEDSSVLEDEYALE